MSWNELTFAPVRTYNPTVAGSRTFFAGGVWVHNCGRSAFNPKTLNHILQPKHNWSKLFPDGVDPNRVAELVGDVMSNGKEVVTGIIRGRNGLVEGAAIIKEMAINGQRVQVRMIEGTNGVRRFSDARVL